MRERWGADAPRARDTSEADYVPPPRARAS
jgi:hypothetical protein